MTGNKRQGIVVQERDRHLLSELNRMRIIDREMTKIVAGFGTTSAANMRLLALTRSGLLKRFFVGSVGHGRKAIYTLSPKGSDLIQSKLGGLNRPANRLIVGDAFVEHQMAINAIYLALQYRERPASCERPRRWVSFYQSISESIKLRPDAYFEIQAGPALRSAFLEMDLGTEALKVWRDKTASYLQLAISGEFERRFRQPQFRVLVVANSDRRLANIRATVAKATDKIFWFRTIESINRDGFWSPLWLRPLGDQQHSLL